MNKGGWFTSILGFIILVIVLVLLAVPYYLVIRFSASGVYITEISKFFIPWSIILFLLLVFNEQIKSVILSIGDLIRRIKKGGIGPVTLDTSQEAGGVHLTKEQVDQFRSSVGKMEHEKNEAVRALRYYFHRTLYLTIYRSQIELLQFLIAANAPVEQKRLKVFYEAAITRNPALKQYSFERYIGYLRDNFLILINAEGKISITPTGKDFVDELVKNNIPIESFPN